MDAAGTDKSSDHFQQVIHPLLTAYCLDCHTGPDSDSGVRLDTLDPDLVNGPDAESWRSVLDRVNSGEMPPEDSTQPTSNERRALVDWATGELRRVEDVRRATDAGAVRRLTKSQYTHSLQELLRLPIDFGSPLPDDGKSRSGFSNGADALLTSPLHVEQWQSIARAALDKAIVTGPRPQTTRYRVTLGLGVGRGGAAAEVDGFQSAPIQREHVRVEVLTGEGEPVAQETDVEAAAVRAIEQNVGVGMRGSSRDRYQVIDEGVLLSSALPHRETPPKSWQGPSPNLKVLLRRCFPNEGPFVMRATVSRALAHPVIRPGFFPRTEASKTDAVALASGAGGVVVLSAEGFGRLKNLALKEGRLSALDATAESSARYAFSTEEPQFYRLVVEHPATQTGAMASLRVRIDGSVHDASFAPAGDATEVVNIYLEGGSHEVEVGGPFFVGLDRLLLVPLPIDDGDLVALRRPGDDDGRYPWLRAFVGNRTDDGMEYATLGESRIVDSPIGERRTFEFTGYLENLPVPALDPTETSSLSNILIAGVWNDHLVKDPRDYGPPLVVHSIEIFAPHYVVWPPESHTSILFASPDRERDLDSYTTEVIERFVSRAYRRPASSEEVDRFVGFWRATRGDFDSYEDGIKEVLAAVLTSPRFLYLAPPTNPEEQRYDFATRLAYFLWDSPPDDRLLQLASAGELRGRLETEVERMVADPRAGRFVRTFVREWLRVDRHALMSPDVDRYPDYTRFVKSDMQQETFEFFRHVMEQNLDVFTLVDSDFAMLNQNLAEFYGVEGVVGNGLRPVPVAAELGRGGLLSQGAFLCGHSDGVQAHPIKRAVWVKEKILGDPPPPPPPNVPELDPSTPGFEKLTLKEQLELHRNKSSCVSCHRKIDPYGIPFEGYDAVGRLTGTMRGKPVDAESQLPDGTVIDGVAAIKAYIVNERANAFRRSLVQRLLAYAIGRDVTYADEDDINRAVEKLREGGDRFQTAILAVLQSDAFQSSSRGEIDD